MVKRKRRKGQTTIYKTLHKSKDGTTPTILKTEFELRSPELKLWSEGTIVFDFQFRYMR